MAKLGEKVNKSLEKTKIIAIIENHKKRLEQTVKIIEALDSDVKLQIILFLYVYGELSLGELSNKLDKSKATISRHVSSLKSLKIVEVRKKQIRSPIKKQFYSISPDFIDQILLLEDQLQTLKPEEAIDILIKELKMDKFFLDMIKNVIGQAIPYFNDLESKLETFGTSNFDQTQKFYYKNRCRYMIWPLDEEEYEFYRNKQAKFLGEIRMELTKRAKIKSKDDITQKSHVAVNLSFPIKKILEFKP